ncbi:protein SPT2 homolog [Grus americana]|uniref:protein SPT2 homolog n=1 Tax=Grus americana TaxID=9117 RepID=UPI0024084060|nr:protein SPT2 homolog [Grus americana]XP_054684675.1 protein SPT2 homolog [Grus americana]XP_054684676.1 protein SPT2 homolog [Grus americana]
MDFHNILMMASEQQGLNAVPKRYSLAVGPPKKVPKVKGVESAAVQAFLRRQEEEKRKKALEERRKKEQLLARRIELKHDRKARAMASRTKDNFYGYNGIPVEEKPKKKRACENVTQAPEAEYATEDEAEQHEYSQTESEHEQEEYEEKPSKVAVKPKAPPKSAPAPLNFAELLRLAEKKQYEPVEIKTVKKVEERPRTAEELREREYLGRKNKRIEMHKKSEKEIKNTGISSSSKKVTSQKESLHAKLKSSVDKHSTPKGSLSSSMSGTDKKSKAPALTEKPSRSLSSSRFGQMEKNSQNGSLKNSTGSSHSKLPVNSIGKSGSSSHVPPSKPASNGAQRLPSAKESSLKKSAPTKSGNAAALQRGINSNAKRSGSSLGKGGPGHPGGGSSAGPGRLSNSGMGPGRPSSSSAAGPGRPGSGSSLGPGQLGGGSGMGPGRPAGSSSMGLGRPGSSSSMGLGRPGSSLGTGPGRPAISTNTGPGRPGNSTGTGPGRPGIGPSTGPGRPGSSLGTGPGRPGIGPSTGAKRPGSSLGPGPGRPGSSPSAGPGRPGSGLATTVKPKCTVVSETISSKNLVTRPSNGQINGMRSFQGHRPVFHPQGLGRPPISYKRQIEDDDDDEYDSEMEDFIEDEGEPQEEISKHIREIFGYDRKRYKDESDYALRYMESSWREQQKEEARSLRLGVQEDLEELRREEEELKRKRQSKKLRTR